VRSGWAGQISNAAAPLQWVAASLIGLLLGSLLAGCGNRNQPNVPSDKQPLADRLPPATQRVTEKPYATQIQPTMVSEGPLPLVYLNPSGANFTFTDLTSKRDLGGSFVAAGEIIKIEKRGVFAGQRQITRMPLDENHRYGIVFQPDPTSVIRTQSGQPTRPPTAASPTSQPATTQP
jgi:hypothetical protein